MVVKVMKMALINNSDFDQDGEGEFLMSDMEDDQKNFPKQKLKPVSNEGKRKPFRLKAANNRVEEMTNMSKFMKLTLEKSTARSTICRRNLREYNCCQNKTITRQC